MTLILKQSTSIDIRIGPFVDATDAVTPETGITLAAADQAEVLKFDGAATAAMAGAFVAVTDADGWYDYTVAVGDVDTVGEVVFVVQDLSVCLPVFVRAQVVEEAVYDAMYLAAAEGPLQATTAGRTLDILATGEVPIDFDTSIGTLKAAQIAAAALNGKGDWNINKSGYALTVANWNVGKTGYALSATGLDAIASTATGMVEIAKAIWDRVLTGALHNIVDSAGRRLRIIQESGSYEAGSVWIDTVNGAAGTTDFENGVDILPTNTIADANTIAASIGLSRFQIAPASVITFPGAQTDEIWEGRDWTLALGGRDITGSFIFGAEVTGIGVATDKYEFEECDIGVVTLDNDGHFERCALTGTLTVGQAGTFTFHQCFTEVAAFITIDFAALGATAIHLLDFHGQVNFKNMAAGDTVHITGAGTITTETCTAGTIDHDGFFEYTDAGDNVTEQQSDIKVGVDDIQTRVPAALVGGRMDANMSAIAGVVKPATQLSKSADTMDDGTASGTPTATTMVSDIVITVDNQFNGRTIIFADDTTTVALRKQATDITGGTASSNTLIFTALTTAPVSGDTFSIV